jgi:segregation and condensation protein A
MYRVHIAEFSGPLDLLLYLVRRQELDILDLPIGRITAQFVEFLETLTVLDFDQIGEFLVLAATLVEIKSREALPREEAAPTMVEEAPDAKGDLVRQLLEYKRFREAAAVLEAQSAEWQLRYPRLSNDRPRAGNDPSEDLIKEVELWDLVSALTRVLKRHTENAPKAIVYDDTPISTYIEQIKARVLAELRVSFSSLFHENFSRSKITGIFLAILELLRHHHFRAEQPVPFGEIFVIPPPEGDWLTQPAGGEPEAGEATGPTATEKADAPPVEEAA